MSCIIGSLEYGVVGVGLSVDDAVVVRMLNAVMRMRMCVGGRFRRWMSIGGLLRVVVGRLVRFCSTGMSVGAENL